MSLNNDIKIARKWMYERIDGFTNQVSETFCQGLESFMEFAKNQPLFLENGKLFCQWKIIDILHICIVLTLHSCIFWSFRLEIMHLRFLLHCISLYQVLECLLEFLEVLDNIWDQKGSGKYCLIE